MRNPSDDKSSFMDSKTIIAILLVGLTWIGWQQYLQKKYPEAYQAPKVTGEPAPVAADPAAPAATLGAAPSAVLAQPVEASDNAQQETTQTYENEFSTVVLSSRGMGLKDIVLKKYFDRDHQPVKLATGNAHLLFETNLLGHNQPVHFAIQQTAPHEFYGVAQVGSTQVEKWLVFQPAMYAVNTRIKVSGASQYKGILTYLQDKLRPSESSFLMPALAHQEVYTAHTTTDSREHLAPDTPLAATYQQVNLLSMSEQYFASALVDQSEVSPNLKVASDLQSQSVLAVLSHEVLNNSDTFEVKYAAFVGPKDLTILQKVDARMQKVIDFGWFSWLAVILFELMQWFHSLSGNYGVAIILLTILVRVFVLPFNLLSYRSMKAMQVVQPQIQALREKYKSDQVAMNREMMALMKEHKANPMGGCLPMLLQFPVFIALYRVFGQSIELYQAPFMLWISDLSLKDPFYVLPVLMAAAMFMQTKLTPSTLDPTQQKVMLIMPVVFALMMAGLPSGLTLYIFVSTIFGIIQQMYFMRSNTLTAPAQQAKA